MLSADAHRSLNESLINKPYVYPGSSIGHCVSRGNRTCLTGTRQKRYISSVPELRHSPTIVQSCISCTMPQIGQSTLSHHAQRVRTPDMVGSIACASTKRAAHSAPKLTCIGLTPPLTQAPRPQHTSMSKRLRLERDLAA